MILNTTTATTTTTTTIDNNSTNDDNNNDTIPGGARVDPRAPRDPRRPPWPGCFTYVCVCMYIYI